MFVTGHAADRVNARLGYDEAETLIADLEAVPGEPGKVVYYRHLGESRSARDGSNGDVIVAVALNGSVDTVFLRRSSQDMGEGHFGARKTVMV